MIQPITVLRGHTAPINCLAYATDSILFSGDLNGTINGWNLNTRRVFNSFVHTSDKASASVVSLVPLNTKLLSSGRDGYIRIWDMEQTHPKATCSWEGYCGSRHFCNVAGDVSKNEVNSFVTSSSNEKDVLLWDIRSKHQSASIQTENIVVPEPGGMVTSVLYCTVPTAADPTAAATSQSDTDEVSSNSREEDRNNNACATVTVGTEGGTLLHFDTRVLNKVLCYAKLSHSQPVLCMSMHPKMGLITVGSATTVLSSVYFPSSNPPHPLIPIPSDPTPTAPAVDTPISGNGAASLAYRADGRVLAVGVWNHTVQLYQGKDMKHLGSLDFHRGIVQAVAFSPVSNSMDKGTHSGKHLLATASADQTIALWDVYN